MEINTLKLRPVGVRIFVENPPDSGNWSKIRAWKADGSLQSVLVQAFFEERRREGIVTRIEVRDGSDRAAEGDTMSLHSVASRIFHPREGSSVPASPNPKQRRKSIVGWLGLGSTRSKPQPATPQDEDATQEEQELLDVPQKVGGTSFLSNPFGFFKSRSSA